MDGYPGHIVLSSAGDLPGGIGHLDSLTLAETQTDT
jgi:hypothetical protein